MRPVVTIASFLARQKRGSGNSIVFFIRYPYFDISPGGAKLSGGVALAGRGSASLHTPPM
jgi:hypothetical protein